MSLTVKRGAFPTHLTPFESYMLIDDHPRFPMTFVYQFDFLGQVDPERLQEAVDKALLRHPLLRSVIQPAKGGRDCWVLAETYDATIDFGDFEKPIRIDGAGEYIDLRNEIGFRAWVRSNSEKTRLVAAFHHSAVDGIGGYRFLNDVLWFYAEAFGNQVGQLVTYSQSDLRGRLRANAGNLRPQEVAAPRFDKYQNQAILPAASPSQPGDGAGTDHDFPQFQVHAFDKNQHRELRLAAQDRGLTLNDCMLESLLVGMMTWNQQQGGGDDQNPFCILMPLDLRRPEHPEFSAVNLVTSSFIRRSAQQIKDRQQLGKSLIAETIKLQHMRHESEFMQQLISAPLDWNDLELARDENRCQASTIFSNAGDPTKRFPNRFAKSGGRLQAGNLLLDNVYGASPLRNQTRMSVNLFSYRRELNVCIRCDPQCFTQETGKMLLDHIVKTFLQSLNMA